MPKKRKRRAATLRVKSLVLRAAVEEMGPTSERATHDEIDGSAVVSRVERLFQDHKITRNERNACRRFYRDWALGVERCSEPSQGPGSASPDAGELRYLIAGERYRLACNAVGDRAAAVLTWLVCREWSWLRIAAQLRHIEGTCDVDAVKGHVLVYISGLADWYEVVDKTPLANV